MKKIFYILLFLSPQLAWAQTLPILSPQVINTAGGNHIFNSGISVTDNVGEPFTSTIYNANITNSFSLTQGFIQPLDVTGKDFTITAFVNDVTCAGKNNGKISTAVTTNAFNFGAQFFWLPNSVCPGNNCSTIDSIKGGSYTLSVVFTYTNAANQTETVILQPRIFTVQDLGEPCRIKVFTGITINGDGANDHLFIENISEFPNNNLTIFNRWGQQLYSEKGYDNVTKIWPNADEASKLVSSTYFYVLDTGDGNKPLKGWIEIIKN